MNHIDSVLNYMQALVKAKVLLNANLRIGLAYKKGHWQVTAFVQGDQMVGRRKIGNLRLAHPKTGEKIVGVADIEPRASFLKPGVANAPRFAIEEACYELLDNLRDAYGASPDKV